MVSFALSLLVLLCVGVRSAATLLETIVAMLLVAILSLVITITAYSVFKGFVGLSKEHQLLDPDASHPSGNTNSRGAPKPPP